MSGAALAIHQFRYDQRIFWRSPAAVFFTVMLPVMFLLIFATIFGNDTIAERGGLRVSAYYVPGIITLAVISASLVGVAIRLTEARESGRLKRLRGTPLPPATYVAGRVQQAFVISVLMVVVLSILGRILYDVPFPTNTIPGILVTLIVGNFSFCCLAFALTAAIPNEDAAPPVTQFVVFPLYFLSGVFIPESEIPDGALNVASIFPIRPFFECFLTTFDPATTGLGIEWGHLAVVAAWGLVGLALAIRFFRWTPSGG